MLSNKPIAFTLVAKLENGQKTERKALAQAMFNQIGDRAMVSKQ